MHSPWMDSLSILMETAIASAHFAMGQNIVVIITGMNKLTPSVEDAYKRIRQDACPPNCVRLGLPTPCSKTGVCGDCMSASSICDLFVTTRMSRYPDRIHIIMVGEELGY